MAKKSPSHWEIDRNGWLSAASCHLQTPFQNSRPTDEAISLCVLHNISLPPKQFGEHYIRALFTGEMPHYRNDHPFFAEIADLQVSAHFFIARNGQVSQYAPTLARAWHAGVSSFHGRDNCNDFSIGIELNGADHIPYTLRQYQSCAKLLAALIRRHPKITTERITRHSDIAPQRKTDPGPAFNLFWLQRLLNLQKDISST